MQFISLQEKKWSFIKEINKMLFRLLKKANKLSRKIEIISTKL